MDHFECILCFLLITNCPLVTKSIVCWLTLKGDSSHATRKQVCYSFWKRSAYPGKSNLVHVAGGVALYFFWSITSTPDGSCSDGAPILMSKASGQWLVPELLPRIPPSQEPPWSLTLPPGPTTSSCLETSPLEGCTGSSGHRKEATTPSPSVPLSSPSRRRSSGNTCLPGVSLGSRRSI